MFRVAFLLVLLGGGLVSAFAQTEDSVPQPVDARSDSSEIARQLGSTDPSVRRKAAEDLARLAAVDQKKIVEGYRLEEKDKRVRLALTWALYRMGQSETLYRIIEDLDSSRHSQAVKYLTELDAPVLLYPFLKRVSNPAKVTVGLLEALSQTGDVESLELIRPFRNSIAPGVAEAAETATDEIEARLAKTEEPKATRPRTASTKP